MYLYPFARLIGTSTYKKEKPFRILPDLLKTITFVLPIFTLRFHLGNDHLI
jgi:hypothetical protein